MYIDYGAYLKSEVPPSQAETRCLKWLQVFIHLFYGASRETSHKIYGSVFYKPPNGISFSIVIFRFNALESSPEYRTLNSES